MHHDVHMRTTIDINDARLKDLRDLARRTGRTLKEVLDEGLQLGLAHMEKPRAHGRVRVKTHRLALKPGFAGASLNQLYDQLEAEEQAGR